MIFHSWEHRRRLRLALLSRNHSEFLQDSIIRNLQKRERARTIAILDSTLALAILLVLGFTLVFIYTVNEDQIPKAFLLIMAVPFVFNVCQLFCGVVLLFITKRNSESHLEKCRQWCYMTKFLSALILFEFFILVQWHFRTLGFGLFGIQYLIRILAIHKVKTFMEELIVESHIVNLTVAAATGSAAAAPTSSSIPMPSSIVTVTRASNFPPSPPSIEFQDPEVQLPTYSEALKQSSQYKKPKDHSSNELTTPPPSYEQVLLLNRNLNSELELDP